MSKEMDKIFLSEPKILTFATIFFTLLPLLTLNGSHPMSVSHQHVRPLPLNLLAVFLGKGALLYVASVIILLCRYVCFSLFIINFLPYLAIYPFGEKGEHGLWHSVAAATVGAGHRHGIYRGLPFDVHCPECVTADITFECCYSSMHTCFFCCQYTIYCNSCQVHQAPSSRGHPYDAKQQCTDSPFWKVGAKIWLIF